MAEDHHNLDWKLEKLMHYISKDILEKIHHNHIDLIELSEDLDISLSDLQDYLLEKERDYLMYRNIDHSIKKLTHKNNKKD